MASPLQNLHPRSLRHLADRLDSLLRAKMWAKVLLGMALGILVGILLGPTTGWLAPDTSSVIAEWLALPGQVFLGLVQMIVVPLIFASIIRGLAASDDLDQLRALGWRLALYFVGTTTIAISIGIGVAYLIRPGRFVDGSLFLAQNGDVPPIETAEVGFPGVDELVGTLLPANPLGSMVSGEMFQVVVFAGIIGIALIQMPPTQSRPLLDLLGSVQRVCMTVVAWGMHLAPLAVFGLLGRLTMTVGIELLAGLAVYVLTVLAGLGLLLCFYVAVAAVVGRTKPGRFLREVRELQLLAFSTSSSAAVMPLSIKTAEDGLGVRPSIAQFIVPLGATVNMDGTALYQGVATVFLAQATGVDLGPGALLVIVLTVVAASIGAPSTPGVGIVLLASVLQNAGIPASAVALIIGVDRILDMARTTLNVTGDQTAALVMDRWVGGNLSAAEEQGRADRHETERAASGADVVVS